MKEAIFIPRVGTSFQDGVQASPPSIHSLTNFSPTWNQRDVTCLPRLVHQRPCSSALGSWNTSFQPLWKMPFYFGANMLQRPQVVLWSMLLVKPSLAASPVKVWVTSFGPSGTPLPIAEYLQGNCQCQVEKKVTHMSLSPPNCKIKYNGFVSC